MEGAHQLCARPSKSDPGPPTATVAAGDSGELVRMLVRMNEFRSLSLKSNDDGRNGIPVRARPHGVPAKQRDRSVMFGLFRLTDG